MKKIVELIVGAILLLGAAIAAYSIPGEQGGLQLVGLVGVFLLIDAI